MFVFGGYTGDIYSNSNLRNKNDLYEYKFTTSQWINWEDRITGDLPPARSAHGAAVCGHHLWIFAGYDGHTRLNDMWRIDLTDPQPRWEQVAQTGDSPPTCCNFPVAVVEDCMYVFSGQSGAKITNKLYRFHFPQCRWVRLRTEHQVQASAPPQRRYGHTMVAYRRCLYVYGGAADGILDNEVHCFDVDSHAWSVIRPAQGSQVPCGRVFHSAAVWNGRMYIFGGTIDSLSNRSGDLFRFGLCTFPKCTLVEDFGRLLERECFCDMEFVLREGAVVQAHVAVLASRSPYLRRRILQAYAASGGSAGGVSGSGTGGGGGGTGVGSTGSGTGGSGTSLGGIGVGGGSGTVVGSGSTGVGTGVGSGGGTSSTSPGGSDEDDPHPKPSGTTLTTTTILPLPTPLPSLPLRKDLVRIPLEDVSSEVFKLALHSLYTDRIHPDLEDHQHSCEGGASVPQMLLMVDVYKLSLLLETRRLEFLSIKYIEASINEENVLLVLKNASELGLSSLKEYCMRFIVQDSNYRKVVMSSSFETLDKALMVQVIRRQLFRSRPTSPDPPSVSAALAAATNQDAAASNGSANSPLPPSLQDDLQSFLDGECGRPFADVVLRVGEEEAVLAHRAVLIARCAYFEALFRSFTPEDSQVRITFGEIVPSLSAFSSLLTYTYCGEISASPEDALYIFSAPNFFGFSNLRLHSHCKASLERDIDQGNVLRILETADTISCQTMKRHCLDMIAAHFPNIVQQRYFRSLRRELLLDIFDILASRMVE